MTLAALLARHPWASDRTLLDCLELAEWLTQFMGGPEPPRITCGSWERVVKPSVTRSGTGGDGTRAILLDPPYATSGDLYAESSEGVALAVRDWCLTAPRELRVILYGYGAEHDALLAHGWSVTEGKAGRGAGYSVNGLNGRRERLWLSPACIGSEQRSLLEALAT